MKNQIDQISKDDFELFSVDFDTKNSNNSKHLSKSARKQAKRFRDNRKSKKERFTF